MSNLKNVEATLQTLIKETREVAFIEVLQAIKSRRREVDAARTDLVIGSAKYDQEMYRSIELIEIQSRVQKLLNKEL